jgi:hypothetical protein
MTGLMLVISVFNPIMLDITDKTVILLDLFDIMIYNLVVINHLSLLLL